MRKLWMSVAAATVALGFLVSGAANAQTAAPTGEIAVEYPTPFVEYEESSQGHHQSPEVARVYHVWRDGTPACGIDKLWFDAVSFFSPEYGIAWVRKDGEEYHIFPDCTPAYEKRFSRVAPFFNEDRAEATNDGVKWFHIGRDGTRAYEEWHDWVRPFSDNRAAVRDGQEKYYIDPDGKRVSQNYDFTGRYSNGRVLVTLDGETFYIDINDVRLD